MKRFDRFIRWTARHKWEYRIVWFLAMGYLVVENVQDGFEDGWSIWTILANLFMVFMFGLVLAIWWRWDVMEEFERHVRNAIGSDANLVILAVRLQLQTRSIWKLNGVMRRHDVMGTPRLDLPPEARELRDVFDDAQRRGKSK